LIRRAAQTGYLPPGVYQTPWPDIPAVFAKNSHRAGLTNGLLRALINLAGAGSRIVLLDGRFVSVKPLPQDYDAAREPLGVDRRARQSMFCLMHSASFTKARRFLASLMA
jgi:hypothetical protein